MKLIGVSPKNMGGLIGSRIVQAMKLYQPSRNSERDDGRFVVSYVFFLVNLVSWLVRPTLCLIPLIR